MIDIGIIDEVEVTLPATTVVLNIVSESSALNVWVHVLAVDEFGVVVLEVFELGEGCGERGLVARLLHGIRSHVSNGQVSVN